MQPYRLASIVIPSLLAMVLLNALPASAGLVPGACSGRALKWECVGSLELVNAKETTRIRFYDDDHTLVEVAQPTTTQRMLVTPGGVWYQGMPLGQGTVPHPFRNLPEAAILPIKLLEMAFPDGPDTVPQQETTQEIKLGDERISISAIRAIDGTVRFKVSERGQQLGHGTYRAGELPLPPSGFDLTQWTRGELPQMLRLNPAQ